jgi:hypothetical protein
MLQMEAREGSSKTSKLIDWTASTSLGFLTEGEMGSDEHGCWKIFTG